ncbi:MAG: response regulator transcription factor [Phycisphaerae bacterium]|nr:response regulator transcription factor [Phycisphaerae bacterium]
MAHAIVPVERLCRGLVADDDPFYRAMVAEALWRAGVSPLAVDNGRDAWEVLTGPEPTGLAVVNWLLPDLDGYRICRLLEGRRDRPLLIVMAGSLVTSTGQPDPLLSAADMCLTKPFGPEALRRCLRRTALEMIAQGQR